MLQYLIEQIESFKKNQFSAFIDKLNATFFNALKHSHFNPQAAIYFISTNQSGPPFTLSESTVEPDSITQIKKLFNALYYARRVAWDIEQIELKHVSSSCTHLMHLWNTTINEAYEACYLLTHIDIEIQAVFQAELHLLFQAVSFFKTSMDIKAKTGAEWVTHYEQFPLSYTIGEISGTALAQMKPQNGRLDYAFLTEFGSLLPGYINQIRLLVDCYSNTLVQTEPSLNDQKLHELKNAAMNLLNDLEHLREQNLFISFKVLKIIHVIRNIITIIYTIIEQLHHFSDSSQDLIRDLLVQLKYHYLVELFVLVDKIEVNCLLAPGTFSFPLMQQVIKLYDEWPIYLAKKPVDFSVKGEELLKIEDSRFMALRLEAGYNHIDKANKALFILQKSQEAATAFFHLLSHEDYQNLSLSELPSDIQDQLMQHYKLFKPLMAQINSDLDSTITQSFLSKTNNTDCLKHQYQKFWQWVKSEPPGDYINAILKHKEKLSCLIAKKKNTQYFSIKLYAYSMECLQKNTDLILFAYSETTSIVFNQKLERLKTTTLPAENPANLCVIDETIPLAVLNQPIAKEAELIEHHKNKTFSKPIHLTAEQTLILYHWYDEKHSRLQKAIAAYTQLKTLLNEFIADYAHIPPGVFRFNRLKTEEQHQLRLLYAEFQPYFITAIPKELHLLASLFDRYLDPKQNEDALSDSSPLLIEFAALDSHYSSFFKTLDLLWRNKIEVYKKQATHQFAHQEQNVFFDDEANALLHAGESITALIFSYAPAKKTVANPEQLSAYQSFALSQWYNNKRNKFATANQAYHQFYDLLHEEAKKYSTSRQTQVTVRFMDDETKAECRKLYSLFQPYFIHGTHAEQKSQALAFDLYLTHSLTEKTPAVEAPLLSLLDELNEHFQMYFTEVDLLWRKKKEFYLQLAHEKYIIEKENLILIHDTHEKRANYLIKHTHFSEFIYEFRKSLKQLTTLFNAAMQKELLILNDVSIPFPELQNNLKSTAQCKQVHAIKKIYNSAYHLEQMARQLELFNDKSNKTYYVSCLMWAYSHARIFHQLIQELIDDPHFHLIGHDLIEKAQNLWTVLQEHLVGYQTNEVEINPLDRKIQYSGIWYLINSLYILPEHIQKTMNKTALMTNELNALHQQAKITTLRIEEIIKASHSSFKLFLYTPTMTRLLLTGFRQFSQLINTLQDASYSNLGHYYTDLAIPILYEADTQEDELGLTPGCFSEPLQIILEEYYKGLLSPLKLPSKEHMAFIYDNSLLTTRIKRIKAQVTDIEEKKEQNDEYYSQLIALHHAIEEYDRISAQFWKGEPQHFKNKLNYLKEQIDQAYKKAHPRLVRLHNELHFIPREHLSLNDMDFDTHLNGLLKPYQHQFKDLKMFIALSYAFYLGKKNTFEMRIKSAAEKLIYLHRLALEYEGKKTQFISQYTIKSFDNQFEALVKRPLGLQYTDNIYEIHLKNVLGQYKNSIIQEAINQEAIDDFIREQLKTRISEFEQTYFAQYYQLDRIHMALNDFKAYFKSATSEIEKKTAAFEDEDTLLRKSEALRTLIKIIENEGNKYPLITERIKKIQSEVSDPNFTRIMLQQKQVSPFSLAYLTQCIFSLLEALSLYHPQKTLCLDALKAAANRQQPIKQLTQQFGLFTTEHLKIRKTAPVANELVVESAPPR